MANAKIQETLSVSKAKLFKAVTQYENYPKFVEGCRSVKVDRSSPGSAQVSYDISMMKDITYTLEHAEDEAKGVVSWKLIKSDFVKLNNGRWNIQEAGPDRCKVEYEVDIEFSFPVPGFILSRLIKGTLPAMLKSFEKQAKSIA
jgi:ribosome-associated toxin RatA of RatAB toxin-antitoxin module